uniref:Patched domain-containing protein 3 n=1 Tax=Ascaris suum TaxID=6253 RepID=F1KUJ6_ASCSU
MRVFDEFGNGEKIAMYVYVVAKDGGTMTRMEYLNETVRILDNIGNGFKIKNSSFYQFCSIFCDVNEPIVLFRDGILLQEDQVRKNGRLDFDRFNMSFPIMHVVGRKVDLGINLHGVTTWTESKQPTNTSSNVKEARVISMLFIANKPALWDTEDISIWEREVSRYYHGEYNSSLVNVYCISVPYVQDEIVRTTNTLLPTVLLGFVIMCLLSVTSVYIGSVFLDQWTYHKISYAINACICPMLATGAALGTLFWFGFRFGSVLYVTPLLVLAIGVDDSFIMINAWERLCDARRGKSLPNDTLAERLAKVMVDVGPSITITSLTNVVAFGISSFSPTPEVSLFCIGNMVAMLFDYFYTISFYPAIMMLSAKYELRMELSSGQKSQRAYSNNLAIGVQNLLNSYCEWLSSKFTFALMILFMIAYWSISIYGALQITPRITQDKLFLLDSPLMEASRIQSNYFISERTEPMLFITKVGNLSDPIRIIRMNMMVEDFELLPESSGAELTRYWIRDYEMYLSTDSEEESELDDGDGAAFKPYSMESINNFLSWPEYRHWRGFMKIDNTTNRIDQFFITLAFHSKELSMWTERLRMLMVFRSIADNYTDLGATVFVEGSEFSDQIPLLLPATIQTSICTLISMTIICCLFMYDKLAVLIASASVFSIFIGVIGLMTLWGIDLDPISMSIIILSIGLSVDFPAHICYHYHRKCAGEKDKTAAQRMAVCLRDIGYPLLQCSLSTMFCFFCTLFVKCYLSEALVKAVVIIVSLGIIHALVIIPAALCGFLPQ